ncbi:hypothetical protein L1987_32803 [Smallanthus sonchifolius]|uniref:Uncharacterized protein n=1 Tax=Smallanthus sonchifolius TaxID=185202 RepID=A0ACB9HQK4_9ASTR|nr:hypothetical protein L1987_32803 [Smallanthus sonchifolius]
MIVKELSIEFKIFSITQVPREDNDKADALANLASALKIPEGPYLRCLEDPEAQEVLKDIHKGDGGNHTGGRALFSRILRTGYYLPTMRKDAMTYAQKCDACQRHRNILHLPAEPLYPVISPWPFMKWGMDIVDKLPKALGGKVFTLEMIDYFSKWIEEEAFVQRLGVKKGRWAEELPFVLLADTTTAKNATCQTPFSLVFGIEAMIPTEMVIPTIRTNLQTPETNNGALTLDLDIIDELRDLAKVRIAAYQQKIEKSYNKNIRIRRFQVSELVLRKAFQNTINPNEGKIAP